jgi:hypothetical protein
MTYDLRRYVQHRTLQVLRMMRPYSLAGQKKIRLGRFNDGGYVMVDDFAAAEAAYSLGINDDVSWDLDIARLGIPVYQYDHTIPRLPEEHELFHWEKKCISGIADPAAGIESLETLIEKNGHQNANNLILKCDIEEAEWLLLRQTPNRILRKFKQIVIELHHMQYLAEDEHADNVRAAIANLTASHKVVHVHANNFAEWVVLGGIPVPGVLELTLLRDDSGEFTYSEETFPTLLDMSCYSKSADFYLGKFVFE